MMNDAGVDVSIRAAKTPVLGAEFYVQPYDNDPTSVEIADFVWSNLAEGMSSPLINSLEDVLHMYEDGYAVLEKVYELREWTAKGKGRNTKTYTMLKKLGVRPTSTIKELQYDDNGGPMGVLQGAIKGDGTVQDVQLDIGKVMIFTFGRRQGDLTGRSLLRTAYQHWYYKQHLYKIDAIQKERHGIGVPKGMLQPGYNANDKSILRTMLRNLRTNEEAFMLLTPNVDVEFAELKGQPVDVLHSADHHNMMILMNVMGQFLALGVGGQGQGSRAVGGVQADLFMKALRYVANYIAEVVNMYLIPELVVYNYPTKNFPQLKVRNIGDSRDLQMLGSALGNLLSQGGLTMDLSTEQWIRGVFDMPALQDTTGYDATVADKQAQDAQAKIDQQQQQQNPNGKGSVNPSGSDGGNKGKPVNAPQ
jgi:hypothetical protein